MKVDTVAPIGSTSDVLRDYLWKADTARQELQRAKMAHDEAQGNLLNEVLLAVNGSYLPQRVLQVNLSVLRKALLHGPF